MKTLAFALMTCTWLIVLCWEEASGHLKSGTSEKSRCGAMVLFWLFIVTCLIAVFEK